MISPTFKAKQGLPVSVTTNSNTRPVSVRTAEENEIDQLNNTPAAKRIYNAKLYGGAAGAAVPLTIAAVALVKSRKMFADSPIVKNLARAAIALAGVYFAVPAAKIASSVSKTLTVFFSTRGNSNVN